MKKKGGVRIINDMSPGEAFDYFIDNCESFKILTLESLACVTLVCDFGSDDSDKECPYESITASTFLPGGVVTLKRRRILLKILLTGRGGSLTIPKVRSESFKITKPDEIIRETEVQHDIYTRSLAENNFALEPICPGLLFVSPSPPQNYCKNKLLPIISEKLRPRKGKERDGELSILKAYFSANSGAHGVIAMDFADGFSVVEDFVGGPLEDRAAIYSLYELLRMYQLGWLHRDFHYGNAMFSKDYRYLGNDRRTVGKSLIIDFGMSLQLGTSQTEHMKIPEDFESSVELLKKEYFGSKGKIFENILGRGARGEYDEETFESVKARLIEMHKSRLAMAETFVEVFSEAREGEETPEDFFESSNMFTMDGGTRGGSKETHKRSEMSEEMHAKMKKNIVAIISKYGKEKINDLLRHEFEAPPVVDFVSSDSSELGFETRVNVKETNKFAKGLKKKSKRAMKNPSKRSKSVKSKRSNSRSRNQ